MESECRSDASVSCDDVGMRCRVCEGLELTREFSVPLSDGPYRYDKSIGHRTVYKCGLCGHLSSDQEEPSRYAAYYASLSDEYHCRHDDDQSRYAHILRLVPTSVQRVLDIGCGTGTFLAMFSSSVERFGVEPSKAAASCARTKGIEIIEYEDLARPELRSTFDVVAAIDVVEHVADLHIFLQHLTAALRPGGVAIFLTGNAASRPARLLGKYWSYLNYAEHLTCFCPSSMRLWLQYDFSQIEITSLSHHHLNVRESLALLRIWLLFPIKLLLRNRVPGRLKMYTVLSLPGDHMLVRAVRN
jgi:SAM-dependent methyltransferase